ncbi:MAG: oligosaccharide flippase family protein [Bacteroidetes bacterium]|nr:oligosaccharide flippase family protein [Bacteroidota bacterium]
MSQDSLKKRYASKLTSKLVQFGLGFVTLGMAPRSLGPVAYGNFGFLTSFFMRTMKFLKFGIPAAYYTKLSKRQNEKKLIGFYAYYVAIVIFIVFICTIGAIKVGFQDIIWPGQNGYFIFAAALFAVLNYISDVIRSTNDAYGYTFKLEIAFIIQSFLATGLILVLYLTNVLTLGSYFLLNYFLLFFVIIAGLRILHKHNIYLTKHLHLAKEEVYGYIKEFYHYSHPLFFNALVVYIVVIADRWLLQKFSGSVEQGYYTLAFKISGLIFLFTSSMSTLLLREMSLSYKDGNRKEIRRLFIKYIPLFFFVAAYLAVFISFNAEAISFIIGGLVYKNASVVIAIMAFYPVHQSYGQLGGAVFLATERTFIIRNIGVSTGVIGFFISLLLMTPVEFFGFGLGAEGLAIKMVLIQFISVNIYLWINTRFLKLSFLKFFGHQIFVITSLSILANSSKYFTAFIINDILINFFITGIIYSVLVLMLIKFYPRIVAMTRKEFNNYINMIIRIMINKIKVGLK